MSNYWEVTEDNFKGIINWKDMIKASGCKVKPRTGRHSGTSGHGNCSSCPGNYYNGGECNYGGRHILSEEIARINSNYSGIDKLQERHIELRLSTEISEEEFEKRKQNLLNDFNKVKDNCSKPEKFIYATCIGVEGRGVAFQNFVKDNFQNFTKGIERYISQVKNATWFQVQEFLQKLKEIENIKQDNNKLSEELKDPNTPPNRRAQIEVIIADNKNRIDQLHQELNKSSVCTLFDPKTESILRFAKKNLFRQNNSDPYANLGNSGGSVDWDKLYKNDKKNRDSEKQKFQNQQGKFLSAETKKLLKKVGWFVVAVSSIWITYLWIKSKFKWE